MCNKKIVRLYLESVFFNGFCHFQLCNEWFLIRLRLLRLIFFCLIHHFRVVLKVVILAFMTFFSWIISSFWNHFRWTSSKYVDAVLCLLIPNEEEIMYRNWKPHPPFPSHKKSWNWCCLQWILPSEYPRSWNKRKSTVLL